MKNTNTSHVHYNVVNSDFFVHIMVYIIFIDVGISTKTRVYDINIMLRMSCDISSTRLGFGIVFLSFAKLINSLLFI